MTKSTKTFYRRVGSSMMLGGALMGGLLLGAAPSATGDGLSPQGGEFSLTPNMAGDQTWPEVAFDSSGGYLVWQDNNTDADGWGISARPLDANLSAPFPRFRVNERGAGNQENPDVTLLPDGGAVFVWQGGPDGQQDIYVRFASADGTFPREEIRVNQHLADQQQDARVAASEDGTVLVTWSSFEQDGDKQGVFGQLFGPNRERKGSVFQVNESTANNQRSPDVAALDEGRFAVVWVSETLKGTANGQTNDGKNITGEAIEVYHVEVWGRLVDSSGNPVGPEQQLSQGSGEPCADPRIAAGNDGFQVVWSQKSIDRDTSWEIHTRHFDNQAAPTASPVVVNDHTYGDQFAPQIARSGDQFIGVWNGLGQDGSFEGVYGRSLSSGGDPSGSEFQINTTTRGKQIYPTVAGDSTQRALVAWSTFNGGVASFDLVAQRLTVESGLAAPNAPYARPVNASRIMVTWPDVDGYDVAEYRLYIDGSDEPTVVQGNHHAHGPLLPGSQHSYQLAFQLANGSVSPRSESAQSSTWTEDGNFDGLPDGWQQEWWGSDASFPGPKVDSDGDGADNLNEFLAGTDPTNPDSALLTRIEESGNGWQLRWNTQPGGVYQVQQSTDFANWTGLGEPRFAPDQTDAVSIDQPDDATYYRVIRIR